MEYRPGQVTELLGIPSSTLRRYVSQFSEHLSPSATKPRGRRFEERDMTTLENIRILLGKGLSPENVKAQLTVVGDQKVSSGKALVTMDDIQRWRDEVAEVTLHLRDEVEELQARIEELEKPWWKRLRRKEE